MTDTTQRQESPPVWLQEAHRQRCSLSSGYSLSCPVRGGVGTPYLVRVGGGYPWTGPVTGLGVTPPPVDRQTNRKHYFPHPLDAGCNKTETEISVFVRLWWTYLQCIFSNISPRHSICGFQRTMFCKRIKSPMSWALLPNKSDILSMSLPNNAKRPSSDTYIPNPQNLGSSAEIWRTSKFEWHYCRHGQVSK